MQRNAVADSETGNNKRKVTQVGREDYRLTWTSLHEFCVGRVSQSWFEKALHSGSDDLFAVYLRGC